jgi:hypothetical protein
MQKPGDSSKVAGLVAYGDIQINTLASTLTLFFNNNREWNKVPGRV